MSKRSMKSITFTKELYSFSGKCARVISVLIIGFAAGACYKEYMGQNEQHPYIANKGGMKVCFTPPAGCGSLIEEQILQAKDTVYMQAYSFTSKPIATALARMKKKGGGVKVILDKTNKDNAKSQADYLLREGIDVSIDNVPGIAHNKVIIVDDNKVITGSFNFSNAADTRNAENVLVLENQEIAHKYLENWMRRYSSAKPLVRSAPNNKR